MLYSSNETQLTSGRADKASG